MPAVATSYTEKGSSQLQFDGGGLRTRQIGSRLWQMVWASLISIPLHEEAIAQARINYLNAPFEQEAEAKATKASRDAGVHPF
jgi:hypothetical protein